MISSSQNTAQSAYVYNSKATINQAVLLCSSKKNYMCKINQLIIFSYRDQDLKNIIALYVVLRRACIKFLIKLFRMNIFLNCNLVR